MRIRTGLAVLAAVTLGIMTSGAASAQNGTMNVATPIGGGVISGTVVGSAPISSAPITGTMVSGTPLPIAASGMAGQRPMPMNSPMPAAPAGMTAQDWQRHYHYPYVYYPHNFYAPEYFKASPYSMMQRYPAEMQIPKYRRDWQNFYPQPKKYYQGYGFKLDIF